MSQRPASNADLINIDILPKHARNLDLKTVNNLQRLFIHKIKEKNSDITLDGIKNLFYGEYIRDVSNSTLSRILAEDRKTVESKALTHPKQMRISKPKCPEKEKAPALRFDKFQHNVNMTGDLSKTRLHYCSRPLA